MNLNFGTVVRLLIGIAVIASSGNIYGQVPFRAPKQDGIIVLTGGTIHVGNGKIITDGTVAIKDGRIAFAGSKTDFEHSPDFAPGALRNARIINTSGKQIYPGLIATNTILGLTEFEAVRATLDFDEVGNYNPNLKGHVAYNADSKIIPTVRANGVLLAQVVPQGGIISGSSSVMQLDAWNWEDGLYKSCEGIHLNWPAFVRYEGSEDGVKAITNDKYDEQIETLKQYFTQAGAYRLFTPTQPVNLQFEATKELFTGSKKLYVHVSSVREIISAVSFAQQVGVKLVIVGGYEAWKCADLLKKNNIPVILQRPQSLPQDNDEDVYLPYKMASILQHLGVQYCISDVGYWQQRNLPFQAGQCVAFGLTKEEALQAITLSPAKILGIDDKTGTLEIGKDANMVVSDGDILDMQTNHVSNAFIQGRQIDLYNSQQKLYDDYRKKYGLK